MGDSVMNHQTVKIYNAVDFGQITKGIKVAQCMRIKSAIIETEILASNLDELAVSESLTCSFCNTVFENKVQQRSHYKLDWHRFNLKQRLQGLKPVTEDTFNGRTDKDEASPAGFESDAHVADEEDVDGAGINDSKTKSPDAKSAASRSNGKSSKRLERKSRSVELKSESSEDECFEEDSEDSKDDALLSIAARHSKVFFENEEGSIFSIYRCLLHNKKYVPEVDNEMIAQALESGKESCWTIIMVGGGHFAAAVFLNGSILVHKTFHTYTVRKKQGSAQSTRDNRNAGSHPKSGGASVRRQNEIHLIQRVQEILESWSPHLTKSSLILYRAVGPFNRTILFGGKKAPLEKSDDRLRPLPFPTRRATLSEVKRVYDVLSNVEIYGLAANFTDSFPVSPRQPIRKKAAGEPDNTVPDESVDNKNGNGTAADSQECPVICTEVEKCAEKQKRSSRMLDRAKARKSPQRPLPDIVAKLALSSSESEFDSQDSAGVINCVSFIEQSVGIDFREQLNAFESTSPRMYKMKSRHKK